MPPTTTRQRRQIREYLRNATALPVLRERKTALCPRGAHISAPFGGVDEQQVSKRSGADVGGDKKWRATRTV